jgi:uncharacterized membrane protein YvbJ
MSIFCPNCNTSNFDEAKFCKNCGVNIVDELKKQYAQEQAEKPTKEHEINDLFDGDSDLMRRYKQEKQDNSYFKKNSRVLINTQ